MYPTIQIVHVFWSSLHNNSQATSPPKGATTKVGLLSRFSGIPRMVWILALGGLTLMRYTCSSFWNGDLYSNMKHYGDTCTL